jgi:hypothetical protein
MKTIRGYIYNKNTNAPLENVVIIDREPATGGTPVTVLSNGVGEFSITVDDSIQELFFYKVGTGTSGVSSFFIPVPTPQIWNIGLDSYSLPDLVITPEKPEKTKMNLWPIYAGVGLLAFLLIRKMRKKKSKK